MITSGRGDRAWRVIHSVFHHSLNKGRLGQSEDSEMMTLVSLDLTGVDTVKQ